jgi:serine/threonine protein kinase
VEQTFPLIMKVPRLGDDQSMEGLLAFETEVMILPVIKGPHFPRFVAAGDIVSNPYLALEWLDGESLAHALKRGAMAPEEVARIGAGIADALHSLHQQNTIHLDLKPDNVILRPNGNISLIDFGLAHHTRYPDLLSEEKRFTAGSTPYVSPEQVCGSREFIQSDLFALGVVLYEMATCQLPFGIPESMTSLRDRLWLDPIPPRLHNEAIPSWLQEIILRSLEAQTEKRYQSAAHIAIDLRQPAQVQLTARASKMRRAGLLSQAHRWWNAKRPALIVGGNSPPSSPMLPVFLAAIDTSNPDDERHAAMRRVISHLLRQSAEFRLICVSVIRGGPGLESKAGNADTSPQVDHLVELRHWVDPFRLPPHQLSMHVLEAANAADALVEFARQNNVDLIVVGAPSPDQQLLAWWRSVASAVTANAHCSVYVVRVPRNAYEAQ